MRIGRGAIAVAIAIGLILLLMASGAVARFTSELLWYRSLGLNDLFWTHWRAAALVRGTAALVILAAVFANLWIVTRSLGSIRVRRRYGNIEIAERLPRGYVIGALGLIAIFSAWWLSGGLADPLPVLAALNPVQWGVTDPAFGLDPAFYVFRLPVLNRLQTMGSLVVFWIALLAVAAYAATGAIKLGEGRISVTRLARRHLGALAAAFLVLYAVNVWLDRYGLVVDGNGFGGVFGYTDLHARLPAKAFVVGLVLLTAGFIAYGSWIGSYRLPIVAGILLPIGLIGAEGVYPASVQRFVVEPNQYPREESFIRDQIEFTRLGFGLDDIERVSLPYDANRDLEEGQLVDRLFGVPLWDPRPLLTTFREQQGLFPYYTFASVHHDRYENAGRVEPVAISVRELETSGLQPAAQTWQNLHLNYVSGAGAVVSPVARMSTGGTPLFYVWDLNPPKFAPEAPPGLNLENPRVYFGELSSEWVILGPEHEPIGIPLDATWKKALFAWTFRSKNILLSSEVTPDRRIVFRRRVADRVQAAAPFLHVSRERSAYPVVADGRIVWVVDGHTTSPTFPLSPVLPFENRAVRYIRNSVKATVDAVTGEVRLYAVDPTDPILATYTSVFPGLVRPLDEMPEEIRSHLRYPVPLMSLQAQVLGAYHLIDPRAFYEQEDVWSVSTESFRGAQATMEPIYVMISLPGSDDAEFVLSLPFVARGRQNMTALMVTRNDPPHYGEQRIYLLPRDEQVPGPQQVEAAIDQDPEVSQQLALWRRGGSDVLRGHLVVVPIDETLVYVEPLFLEAENAAIPQLERVILARPGRVVMQPTFESAVASLLRGESGGRGARTVGTEGPDTADPTLSIIEPLARARRILDEAEALLRAGDWAGFGRALEELRETLTPPLPPP